MPDPQKEESSSSYDLRIQPFRDAVEYSAIGIATVGLDGSWITLNKALCDLLGYTQEELLGRTFQDITHPEDLNADLENVGQMLAGKLTHYHMEKRYFHKDGRVIWAILSVSLVRDADQKPNFFVSQIQDITHRKLVADELAASTNLLREFIEHTPAAIAMCDRDMRYLHVSDRWLLEYELERDQIIGQSHYDLFPDQAERWHEVYNRVLQGGTEGSPEEELTPRPDGSPVWSNWEIIPWRDAKGEIGGLIQFNQNITAQIVAKQELERLVQELARSNSELGQFAYVASHDMQEPLRAVAGCAEILKSRYGDQLGDSADELISHIVDGASRMQGLINDLLQISQVSSRATSFVRVDTNEACRAALLNLDGLFKKSATRIELGDLPVVMGDPTQITQVFQNLISNAIKYRKEESPLVTITAQKKQELWEFSFADNGIGISPEFHDKIFGIFQRLHTRNEYPGSGIGLALCKKIIERHRGTIWLKSALGTGSIFYFTLPHS